MSKSEDAPKGTLTTDPELSAMNAIAKRLNALEPDARGRVMSWLWAKYQGYVNPAPSCNAPPLGGAKP